MDSATKLALAVSAISAAPVFRDGLARLAARSVKLPARATTWLTSLVLLLTVEAGTAAASVPPPADRMARLPEPTNPPDPDRDEPGPAGEDVAESPQGGRTYRVRPGDSLWAIACRDLSQGDAEPSDREIDAHWRAIYRANRSLLGPDPDLIFPGQELVLPVL